MNRVIVDASMDGLPMNTVLDDTPTARPLHDKAVNDGPTTLHGPLANQPEMLDDRRITAQFASASAAEAARRSLLDAGIGADAIEMIGHAADSAAVKADAAPADDTLIGRIREAILPDEASAGTRAAIAADAAILNVMAARAQVETVVRILEASHPTRFDADLSAGATRAENRPATRGTCYDHRHGNRGDGLPAAAAGGSGGQARGHARAAGSGVGHGDPADHGRLHAGRRPAVPA